MARSRKHYQKKKMTIPLAVVAGFTVPLVGVWNRRSSATAMGNYLVSGMTGYDPGTGQFNFANLRMGAVPILAGFIAHAVASKIGINRAIARAGIPWVRI